MTVYEANFNLPTFVWVLKQDTSLESRSYTFDLEILRCSLLNLKLMSTCT